MAITTCVILIFRFIDGGNDFMIAKKCEQNIAAGKPLPHYKMIGVSEKTGYSNISFTFPVRVHIKTKLTNFSPTNTPAAGRIPI